MHYSSDYVFDGTAADHTEDEPLSPLGVYAQTKAAGDLAVATAPRHYLVRTSWVIGDGNNFVRTMQSLAEKGVSPSVVDDQVGRLTFTAELARATRHLVDTGAAYGTYNVTNGGPAMSWADLAQAVFERSGPDAGRRHPGHDRGVRRRSPRASPSHRARCAAMSLDKIRGHRLRARGRAGGAERYWRATSVVADGPASTPAW